MSTPGAVGALPEVTDGGLRGVSKEPVIWFFCHGKRDVGGNTVHREPEPSERCGKASAPGEAMLAIGVISDRSPIPPSLEVALEATRCPPWPFGGSNLQVCLGAAAPTTPWGLHVALEHVQWLQHHWPLFLSPLVP